MRTRSFFVFVAVFLAGVLFGVGFPEFEPLLLSTLTPASTPTPFPPYPKIEHWGYEMACLPQYGRSNFQFYVYVHMSNDDRMGDLKGRIADQEVLVVCNGVSIFEKTDLEGRATFVLPCSMAEQEAEFKVGNEIEKERFNMK